MNQNIHHSISQNVQKYRRLNNMTQKELAGLLNLSVQYYIQLERGKHKFTIDKLVQICEIFHIGIEKLVEVNLATDTSSDDLTEKLFCRIESLSYSQLIVIEKFISEYVPYIK